MQLARLFFPDTSASVNGYKGECTALVPTCTSTRKRMLTLFKSQSYTLQEHNEVYEQVTSLRDLHTRVKKISAYHKVCCLSIQKIAKLILGGAAIFYLGAEGVNAYAGIYDECNVPPPIEVLRKVLPASFAALASTFAYLTAQNELYGEADAICEILETQIWKHKLFRKLHIQATYQEKVYELIEISDQEKGDAETEGLLDELSSRGCTVDRRLSIQVCEHNGSYHEDDSRSHSRMTSIVASRPKKEKALKRLLEAIQSSPTRNDAIEGSLELEMQGGQDFDT